MGVRDFFVIALIVAAFLLLAAYTQGAISF